MQTTFDFSAPIEPQPVTPRPAICEGVVKRDTEGTRFAHLYLQAFQAYSNTSHYPERRGTDTLLSYGQELTDDLAKFDTWAVTDEAKALVSENATRYAENYESHLRGHLSAMAGCASSFITGGSNFPVRQQEKRHATERKRYDDWREWREKALTAIRLKLTKAGVVQLTELQKAEKELAQRTMNHEKMKAANAIIRRGKDVESQLLEIFSPDIVDKIINPPAYINQKGFASFELTNNNAEIKRLTARVEELKAKEYRAETVGNREIRIEDGWYIVLNYELDRLQIIYDSKPDLGTITRLKQNGFKWAPSQSAWQRQLTRNAEDAACRLMGNYDLFK